MTFHEKQTVWNRGGRTLKHVRHLPRLPFGNVGIEGTSPIKHYPPPERREQWTRKRWRAGNDANQQTAGGVN